MIDIENELLLVKIFNACNIIIRSFILNNRVTTVLSQIPLQEQVLKLKLSNFRMQC